VVEEGDWAMNERREPVRVPEEVLEGLEAVRRYAGTDVLNVTSLLPSCCTPVTHGRAATSSLLSDERDWWLAAISW
jgi:hypothetical protein